VADGIFVDRPQFIELFRRESLKLR